MIFPQSVQWRFALLSFELLSDFFAGMPNTLLSVPVLPFT